MVCRMSGSGVEACKRWRLSLRVIGAQTDNFDFSHSL